VADCDFNHGVNSLSWFEEEGEGAFIFNCDNEEDTVIAAVNVSPVAVPEITMVIVLPPPHF
jgi:hypothetical protein